MKEVTTIKRNSINSTRYLIRLFISRKLFLYCEDFADHFKFVRIYFLRQVLRAFLNTKPICEGWTRTSRVCGTKALFSAMLVERTKRATSQLSMTDRSSISFQVTFHSATDILMNFLVLFFLLSRTRITKFSCLVHIFQFFHFNTPSLNHKVSFSQFFFCLAKKFKHSSPNNKSSAEKLFLFIFSYNFPMKTFWKLKHQERILSFMFKFQSKFQTFYALRAHWWM